MLYIDEKSLKNSEDGVLIESMGNENLLVSFGGINQGLGMPVFEFFNSINNLQCDKIFLRDFNQMWYQKGVDDSINNLANLENFLKKKIKANKYKKIVFLGNSMGGYGAILLGVLLNVDRIISFAPQTFIDRKNRLISWDFRWRKQMKNVHRNKDKNFEFFDLKKYFMGSIDFNAQIDIYYSSEHRLDKIHAERLKEFSTIKLYPYSEGGHSVVKNLRDSGELQSILFNLFK